MVIHGEVAAVSCTFMYWYYVIYIERAAEFATFLNMTLTGNIMGGGGEGRTIKLIPNLCFTKS